MRPFARFTLLAAMLVSGALAYSQISYKYVTFKYPGAVSTSASGINNSNVIVGTWQDSKNVFHGYRYANSSFTNLNYPGALSTWVTGINDYGDIVGYYTTSANASASGFKLHAGAYSKLNYPGAEATSPMGINKYGEVVGQVSLSGSNYGFIYKGGTWSHYSAPSNAAPYTILNGVSNLGTIVGQVFSYDNWRGFLLMGSDVDFKAPTSARDNQAFGVNGHGDVVGCNDGNNGWLALNPESGETESTETSSWKTQAIQFGSNINTCPMGITYNRAIVGNVTVGYGTYPINEGFLAVPQ